MTTVITSIMGAYDSVPPIPLGFDEAILVSDVPIDSDWSNVVMRTGLPSRLAAKIPKFRPDMFTSCETSVWIDATFQSDSGWLFRASMSALETSDLVFFKHPERNTVFDEIIVSKSMEKYKGFPLDRQLEHYKSLGFADDFGLLACTVIARRHTLEVEDLGNAWLAENLRWSIQDQVSLPYLLWRKNVPYATFEEKLWNGPLIWKHHIGRDVGRVKTIRRNLFNRYVALRRRISS
jgi:hypothetical protein